MTATVFSVLAGLGLLAVTPAQVGGFLQTVLLFVVVVGILVFVHELGHFLVAKRAGIGVLKFSLGFGPKAVGVRRGETEYLLSAIPLGGYVKMVGEDPADQTADPAKSFQNKSVGWRALVVLAGPGSNVILAVLFFALHSYLLGQPTKAPVVGGVDTGSAAGEPASGVPITGRRYGCPTKAKTPQKMTTGNSRLATGPARMIRARVPTLFFEKDRRGSAASADWSPGSSPIILT